MLTRTRRVGVPWPGAAPARPAAPPGPAGPVPRRPRPPPCPCARPGAGGGRSARERAGGHALGEWEGPPRPRALRDGVGGAARAMAAAAILRRHREGAWEGWGGCCAPVRELQGEPGEQEHSSRGDGPRPRASFLVERAPGPASFESSDKNTSAITLLPSASAAAPAQPSPSLPRVAAASPLLWAPDTAYFPFSARILSLNYGLGEIEPKLKLHKEFIFLSLSKTGGRTIWLDCGFSFRRSIF